MVAKFPTAVTFDVRRGDNPQVQQSQSFQMSSAPMPPPPTQPPPKFSPPSITNAPTIPVIPTVPTIPGATRKFEDEIVKVLSDRCRDSDKQPIEDYYSPPTHEGDFELIKETQFSSDSESDSRVHGLIFKRLEDLENKLKSDINQILLQIGDLKKVMLDR